MDKKDYYARVHESVRAYSKYEVQGEGHEEKQPVNEQG